MASWTRLSHLSNLAQKLRFLRGNLWLLFIWPIVAFIIAFIGWNILLSNLEKDRHNEQNIALKTAATTARSYAENLNNTIEALDQFVLHVRYEWELSKGQLQLEDIQSKGLFAFSPYYYVYITDRNGLVVTSTVTRFHPVSLADRDYFITQKKTPADILYIAHPIYGRISSAYIIQFTRKLINSDGSFGGIVVVSVAPEYFTTNYDKATLANHGLLGMIGQDGLIRVSRIGDAVHPPAPSPFTSIPRFTSPDGSMRLDGKTWFADGRSRYVGWQAIKGYPLVAFVGLDEKTALASYTVKRNSAITGAIWATVALSVFTLLAMALSLRLAWRKYQLALLQTTYRMATESGNEGFYIARPIYEKNNTITDFSIVDCNERGADFFTLKRNQLIGKSLAFLRERTNTKHLIRMLYEAFHEGFYESEFSTYGSAAMPARWFNLKAVRSNHNLAVTLRDITDTKAHVAALERRSNEDALTGLPNRHWVNSYLPRAVERAAANHTKLALLFIDLDSFKNINDTMGHAAGDEVLLHAAQRLKVAVRPEDYVVRLGGDEFVVILESISRELDAAHVAERIIHAFQEKFQLSASAHAIGTSIGISVFPTDAHDADTLLKNADVAMYSVKTSGKMHYRFFDKKFYDALRTRLQKESELRLAIEKDEFVMYYQPRIDIPTNKTSSLEALIRWLHPTKGLLEPYEFIPLAEETGLILDIGKIVINKVCAQLAVWKTSGQELVPVSINISSRQFNEADTASILLAALSRHNIDPKLIEIELTESSMMGDTDEISDALRSIQRIGIKLLVDDFGTGYSSLSQLQRMDFDVLKVDRAFTSRITASKEGEVFFKAIITMAHALDMRVVAEGVETEQQVETLKALQCDEIQGFYFSRPVPPTEIQPILPQLFAPLRA